MRPAATDPPEIEEALWRDVASGDVAYDVGANCGQSLPHLAAQFGDIYAFEPAAECLGYLAAWGTGVHVCHVAVSDVDGTTDLLALPGKIATGQLVTPGVEGMDDWGDTSVGTTRTVACRTLDSLVHVHGIPFPDFVKVDVEGHEDKVLAGALSVIQSCRPQWLIEFHSADLARTCTDVLTRYGYDLRTVRHPHYPPGSHMWHQHGWLITRSD